MEAYKIEIKELKQYLFISSQNPLVQKGIRQILFKGSVSL
jgi:hypothetical protein